jgi:hypothetical protein
MNRQVTSHLESILPIPGDGGALEGQRRVLLDAEEVGRAQVRVAIAFVGVDAGRPDRDLHRGRLRLLFVVVDCSIEIRETTPNFRQQVPHLEGHLGMRFIDAVGCLRCSGSCSSHELLL